MRDMADFKTSLLDAFRDEEFVKILRDNILAPILGPVVKAAVKQAIAAKDREIADLRGELKEVRDEMNALEQYSRRNCLDIAGVPETPNENTDDHVIGVARALGVPLGKPDIEISHRVGRPRDGKTRKIIVKFVSYRKRQELYAERKKLRAIRDSNMLNT